VFDIQSPRRRPHTDPTIWNTVDRLLPRRMVREFNWAMLDLAALVCRPKHPKCEQCPVKRLCRYYRQRRAA
jgi:A/G-specific adenine glycosylase